jgi:hypothetical protein
MLGRLDAACTAADDLEQAAVESFNQHPDAGIITSFPGLGALTGARVLAETGDDRSRFQDAKGLKAYAGAAPVTRASGKTKSVTRRHVKNNRLNAAGYTWAFSAISASPGARAHYDRCRDAGRRQLGARLNGPSLPLDIGYSETIPAAIRDAVTLRDKHCQWAGRCDQPAEACQVHHTKHKADGGPTSVTDCVLLCWFHHQIVIHRWGWSLVLNPKAPPPPGTRTRLRPATATDRPSAPGDHPWAGQPEAPNVPSQPSAW